MKKIDKPEYMNIKKYENQIEDFGFLLWKAELNKELLTFWKALVEK